MRSPVRLLLPHTLRRGSHCTYGITFGVTHYLSLPLPFLRFDRLILQSEYGAQCHWTCHFSYCISWIDETYLSFGAWLYSLLVNWSLTLSLAFSPSFSLSVPLPFSRFARIFLQSVCGYICRTPLGRISLYLLYSVNWRTILSIRSLIILITRDLGSLFHCHSLTLSLPLSHSLAPSLPATPIFPLWPIDLTVWVRARWDCICRTPI